MIPVYICEDEAAIRATLEKEICDYIMIQNHDMELVCATQDPKKLLDACKQNSASGIYFLDIDLGLEGFTGFDLAREIRNSDARGAIVFVTTHGELSMETFRYRLEAMDYILKDNMETMRSRIRECIDSVQQRILQESLAKSEYYTVKVFDTIHNIPISQILYFETSPQKHRICLHATQEILEFFGNLQTIEDTIGSGFFRCHRSFLVNREKIRAIHLKSSEVELVNGQRCPLARRAKKELETGQPAP